MAAGEISWLTESFFSELLPQLWSNKSGFINLPKILNLQGIWEWTEFSWFDDFFQVIFLWTHLLKYYTEGSATLSNECYRDGVAWSNIGDHSHEKISSKQC